MIASAKPTAEIANVYHLLAARGHQPREIRNVNLGRAVALLISLAPEEPPAQHPDRAAAQPKQETPCETTTTDERH